MADFQMYMQLFGSLRSIFPGLVFYVGVDTSDRILLYETSDEHQLTIRHTRCDNAKTDVAECEKSLIENPYIFPIRSCSTDGTVQYVFAGLPGRRWTLTKNNKFVCEQDMIICGNFSSTGIFTLYTINMITKVRRPIQCNVPLSAILGDMSWKDVMYKLKP